MQGEAETTSPAVGCEARLRCMADTKLFRRKMEVVFTDLGMFPVGLSLRPRYSKGVCGQDRCRSIFTPYQFSSGGALYKRVPWAPIARGRDHLRDRTA